MQSPGFSTSNKTDAVRVVGAISRMMVGWNQKPADAAALAEVFLDALVGFPVEEIEAAARRFLRAEVAGRNNAFPPSVPEFVENVRAVMLEDARWRKASGLDRVPVPALAPPPPMKPIERGYHPSWDLLASRPLGHWRPAGDVVEEVLREDHADGVHG